MSVNEDPGQAGDAALVIEPPARDWRLASPTPEAIAFRRDLGLPTDAPIVMTGHQAEFWHVGIVAKFLAAQAFARKVGGASAWLIVDQDDNDAGAVRYPAAAREHELIQAVWRAGPRAEEGVPTGCQRAFDADAAVVEKPALPCVSEGLARAAEALRSARGEASAARQITRANRELFQARLSPKAVVYASDLGKSALFADLVERMGRETTAACEAYNSAARATPRARLRPLSRDAKRGWELPLWRLTEGEPRMAVHERDLARLDIRDLAPRALLATGLMRIGACDLFIHGTGGAKYDAATDAWLAAWLGRGPDTPSVVVSATRVLPFTSHDVPDPIAVSHARMAAHRARHHPALLGDEEGEREKRAMLSRIASAPRASSERAALYRAMHHMLADRRPQHQARLDALRKAASEQIAQRVRARLIHDRTWAAALHPPETIEDLAREIDSVFERTTR